MGEPSAHVGRVAKSLKLACSRQEQQRKTYPVRLNYMNLKLILFFHTWNLSGEKEPELSTFSCTQCKSCHGSINKPNAQTIGAMTSASLFRVHWSLTENAKRFLRPYNISVKIVTRIHGLNKIQNLNQKIIFCRPV